MKTKICRLQNNVKFQKSIFAELGGRHIFLKVQVGNQSGATFVNRFRIRSLFFMLIFFISYSSTVFFFIYYKNAFVLLY